MSIGTVQFRVHGAQSCISPASREGHSATIPQTASRRLVWGSAAQALYVGQAAHKLAGGIVRTPPLRAPHPARVRLPVLTGVWKPYFINSPFLKWIYIYLVYLF